MSTRSRPRTKTATLDERIVRDPDVLLGKPIVPGARMPVYLIVGLIENRQSPEEIVEDFPDLSIENVETAIAYAARSPETLELRLR
jgi:uncharacterized protein (DUF433 family)